MRRNNGNLLNEDKSWKDFAIIGLGMFTVIVLAGASLILWSDYKEEQKKERERQELALQIEKMEKERQLKALLLQERQLAAAEEAKRQAAINSRQQSSINAARAKNVEIQKQLNASCQWWQSEYYRSRTTSNQTMMTTACARAAGRY